MNRISFKIKLSNINEVKDFTSILAKYDNIVDIEQGRYCVDGKSILGIFSLDLSKEFMIHIYGMLNISLIDDIRKYEVQE